MTGKKIYKVNTFGQIVGAVAVQGEKGYVREHRVVHTLPPRVWRKKKNRRKMQRESRRRNR